MKARRVQGHCWHTPASRLPLTGLSAIVRSGSRGERESGVRSCPSSPKSIPHSHLSPLQRPGCSRAGGLPGPLVCVHLAAAWSLARAGNGRCSALWEALQAPWGRRLIGPCAARPDLGGARCPLGRLSSRAPPAGSLLAPGAKESEGVSLFQLRPRLFPSP